MSRNTVGYTETENFVCLEDMDQLQSMRSMNPLNLYYCGRENCAPGWVFGPYVRKHYVIHVVTSGRGSYSTGGREYRISEGQMFIIYPGEMTLYRADENEPWSYTWVGFDGHLSEALILEMGFLRESPVVTLDDTKEIADSIKRIMSVRELTRVGLLKRNAAFMEALAAMLEHGRHGDAYSNIPEAKYVYRAVELIAESYSEKIKISDIADKVGINRSYMTSIFKKVMNMSPQEFLINLRLEKSAQMLRETEESVGSIAAAVGYTDALTFSKAFKQKYNETPREFRHSAPELDNREVRGDYHGKHRL